MKRSIVYHNFKRFKFVNYTPWRKISFPSTKNSSSKAKKTTSSTTTNSTPKYHRLSYQELGKGAYGVVYKAREKGTKGEWRAVKKIAKKNIKNPDLFLN